MSHPLTPTIEFRNAALRIVAAAEYFKTNGELPPWARAELARWSDREAIAPRRCEPGTAAAA